MVPYVVPEGIWNVRSLSGRLTCELEAMWHAISRQTTEGFTPPSTDGKGAMRLVEQALEEIAVYDNRLCRKSCMYGTPQTVQPARDPTFRAYHHFGGMTALKDVIGNKR